MINIVKFEPPLTLSDRDKILASLKTMVEEIEDGTLSPSHLVYFIGEEHEGATSYEWDAIGLNYYEVIGHLTAYVNLLSSQLSHPGPVA